MKEWRGIWLPDGETHLVEWMEKRNEIVDGVPTYQYHKLRAAVDACAPTRRRVAIDIGAHCGLWSMHLVREFGKLFAFEPMTEHRRCWFRNMPLGCNASMIPMALGDRDGTVRLTTGPASSGDTWVIPDGSDAPEAETATMVRLDAFRFDNVDFIKVDCEGFELPILRGAAETILSNRPVICVEQKPGHAQRFGYRETEAVDYLVGLGYQVRQVLSGDYVMVPS